ncbi:MAG: PDZ domain-containing protein [Planctomycetota bacterium]
MHRSAPTPVSATRPQSSPSPSTPRPSSRARLRLALLPLLLGVACTTYERQYYVGHDRLELARREQPDGSVEKYVLEVGQGRADASLTVVTEYQRERGFLGLQVRELDRDAAERRGVEPFRGLLVTGTYPRSAAVDAGVLPGDVVLRIGDQRVVYARQLATTEASLSVDRDVPVRVLRGSEELELSLRPRTLREDVIDPQPIVLEQATPRRPYAGVVLRGIPQAWSARIFGDDRNAIVIASVDVGSPAWVAGFRAGDLIEAVDGGAVPPLEEFTELVHSRGVADQPLGLRVRRGAQDTYEATIALADYTESRQVWFPLLFRVKDGARRDEWSVGPFGMIANDTSTYVDDPAGREPETRNVFNALLGAIRVESGPREDSLRLLWLIHIDL